MKMDLNSHLIWKCKMMNVDIKKSNIVSLVFGVGVYGIYLQLIKN